MGGGVVTRAQLRPARTRLWSERRPCLLGLGTAVPALALTQREIARRLARAWGLRGPKLDRWRRIVEGSRIERRFGVMLPERVVGLSTEARMAAYERHAAALAAPAAARALAAAGVRPDRVTDLVVVTCTGFAAPGLDVDLVERLGLAPTVRRTVVGFMGCFGAIIGLRSALGVTRAEPGAIGLVVCLELCSLHLRMATDPENLVASALFSDGAAAAVVGSPSRAGGSGGSRPIGALTFGASRLIVEGRDWMSWRITDAGFAMTLDRRVPAALAANVAAIVEAAAPIRPACHLVHPGGAAILDAVERSLDLDGDGGLDAARAVLRGYGNMSSATLLFVLAEALAAGCGPPALLLAFGPGLSVESLLLLPVGRCR